MNADMIELHCRKCKRSVDFQRAQFPDVPAWVARIEHDKCNICDDGDFAAEHWMDADGHEPDRPTKITPPHNSLLRIR